MILSLTAPSARAALDPEARVAYQLQVVLRFADHPHFTDYLRREVRKELQRELQAALGSAGSVEILDPTLRAKEQWPPLWRLVDDKGLEALDGFNQLGGGKTHFVDIGFSDGSFDLRARQFDGACGFATPIVRHARTHDRHDLARHAALLVGHDFGLMATLNPAASSDRVFVTAKAGQLGPLDRWVKKGELFAVIAIRDERRAASALDGKGGTRQVAVRTGQRVDGTLLQVVGEPRDGVIPCRMIYRYKDPVPLGSGDLRCIKLGTTTCPLRLRLVEPSGSSKATALRVYARASDYPDGDKETEEAINRDGVFVSKGPLANVALVRVFVGSRQVARMPIEMLDDRVEVRSIRLDASAEARDRLDSEKQALLARLTDERLIQVRSFQEMTALEQAGKKAEALEKGQSTFKLLEAAAKGLQEEVDALRTHAAKAMPKGGDAYVNDCMQQLQAFQARQKDLERHLELLKGSIALDNDPAVQAKKKQLQDLIRDAELLATQAEYDKALAKYEQLIALTADEPAARQKLEGAYQALLKAWRIKGMSAECAKARQFISETWPKLATIQQVRDQLPQARKAFETCRAAHDRLAINKMHLASVEVASRFGDELKRLTAAAKDEEEVRALESYQKLSDDLRGLLSDMEAYLLSEAKK